MEISPDEILTDIEAIGKDGTLYLEKSFSLRLKAIDDIDVDILGRINALVARDGASRQTDSLGRRVEKIRKDLEDVDARMFDTLRLKISRESAKGEALMQLIGEHVDKKAIYEKNEVGYTGLDVFLNGLLTSQHFPIETKSLEPEMVYFQKTPARMVFELVERCHFTKEDVFVDIGSGMGQVVILVNILSGIRTVGQEFEPAFSKYAKGCAAELNLSDATFINVDAREANYSDGTVFFMFTPFQGEMLEKVLAMLEKESRARKIRIVTLGPCTMDVALQPWLDWLVAEHNDIYKLGLFSSL